MKTKTWNSKEEYFEALRLIRESYKLMWKEGERGQDPYKFWDWSNFFTPIENDAWADIRYIGLPMYPQFPVGKYYIDFADPIEKIAIELDGKIHLTPEVLAKDREKDAYLERNGWTIYRIEGWKTVREHECDEDHENCCDTFSTDFLKAIWNKHYSQGERIFPTYYPQEAL